MGITYIIAGIIFLLNPSIRMLDFLPDFMGCVLLLIGLQKLYVLDERIERARKAVLYFTAVSAVKIPMSMYFPIKAKQYLLPFSFIFSVIEIILMIMLFVSLIGGLEYLTSRDSTKKGHGSRSQSASIISFIFSITRGICGFAPELLVLGEQTDSFDYTFRPTPEQNAALIKPYAEVLCFALILIFGIYTGVVLIQYFVGLKRDDELIDKLTDRYRAYEAENIHTFTHSRMKLALFFLGIGVLLLPNLPIDGINVLPNTLSYLLFIIGSLLLFRASRDSAILKKLWVFLPLIPLSIYNNVVQSRLICGTNIDIMGVNMTVREVPELLKSLDFIPETLSCIAVEYVLIGVFLFMLLGYIGNLEILRENDTVGIFEILLCVSLSVFLVSSVCVWFFPLLRTACSYITNDISAYIRFDSMAAISEWVSYASLVLSIYFSFKYASDVLSRIKQ